MVELGPSQRPGSRGVGRERGEALQRTRSAKTWRYAAKACYDFFTSKNQANSKTLQSPASIASGYLSDSHKCSVLVKFSLCRSRSSACGYPVDTVCIRAAGRAVFWVSGAPVSGCGGADWSSEPGCSVDAAAKEPPLEPPRPPLRRSRWTSESISRRRAPSACAPSSPAARRARPGSPRLRSPCPRRYRPCPTRTS